MKKTAVRKRNRIKRTVVSFLSLFLSVFGVVCPSFMDGQEPYRAYASASETNYAQSYVMDDLKDMTIDGKTFNLADYSFSSSGETNVLQFVEYCYSYDAERQGNYNLFVYVHNPKGKEYVESDRNAISLRYGGSTGNFKKYSMDLLSVCEETDYERLFYKYGVNLTSVEKSLILAGLSSAERIYEVGEVELVEAGRLTGTAIDVRSVYSYSGYAKGYGANVDGASTLRVMRTDSETLTLDVEPTFYRPAGTNGKNEYTQDTLHSVYFAVPKSVEKKYGNMSAVHATWLSAYLAPYLVTGNQAAYSAILPYLGKYVYGGLIEDSGRNTDLEYAFISTKAVQGLKDTVEAAGAGYIAYNVLEDYGIYDKLINYLYILFYAENSNADIYTVQSEDIIARLEESATKFGGELINEKYAACMFESVDKKFTEVNIQADEEYSLTSTVISNVTWWEKLFGKSEEVRTKTFDGIKAIYAVQESDVVGSATEVCQRLCISEGDYEAFTSYYEEHKAENTVYLFRYRTSDYVAQEVTEYKHIEDWALIGGTFNTYEVVDTNARFVQQAVDLDFDIIDVTFKSDSVETVLPVVMSPLDIVHDGTPPVYTQSDDDGLPWWLWVIIGVVALFVLSKIKPIWEGLKIVFLIVTFPIWGPIKGIIWIVRQIRGNYD